MNNIEKVIAVAIVILVSVTVLAQTYRAGQRSWKAYSDQYAGDHAYQAGYSDGWRDAHCGVGNSCESGDE